MAGRALVPLGVFVAWACSSSTQNTIEEVCKDESTQACSGDGCIGVQVCIDGKQWSPCDCATGGSGGVSGSGGVGSTTSGGTAGDEGDASSDASVDGSRDASPDCSTLYRCAEKLPCCELGHDAGIEVLKGIVAGYTGACSCDSNCGTLCSPAKPSILVALGCLSCLDSMDQSLHNEVINDCSANSSCLALFDCLGICA